MASRLSSTDAGATGPGLSRVATVAAVIIAVSMGLRQCFGLFQADVSRELEMSAHSFGFALALQNLVWGASQPVLGALGDRFGPRPVLFASALVYSAGLLLMASSDSAVFGMDIGIGVLGGLGVAGTGFGVLLGAVSRAAPPARRSQLLGLVSGVGSAGVLALAPLGQHVSLHYGWRSAALIYAAICLSMVALSLFVGGRGGNAEAQPHGSRSDVLRAAREALSHGGFLAMTVAFFACGFQLMFITAHLPRFLGLCGLPPSVGASALGTIGVCNAVGSYIFGLLGARYSRRRLLATIYAVRTVAIAAYVAMPITETSTILFAAVMGFTWLGVVPLVSGLIGKLFGLGNFNMLFGLVFFCHQLGGFMGPLMGGYVLDLTGSYTVGWYAMIAIGLTATVLQWPMDDEPRAAPQGLARA